MHNTTVPQGVDVEHKEHLLIFKFGNEIGLFSFHFLLWWLQE